MLTGAFHADLVRAISDGATGSLIAAVWQATLLALAAWLGLRLLPKTPAAARFAIWFTVFALAVVLPLAGVWGIAGVGRGLPPGAPQHAWLTLDARWSEGLLAAWALATMLRAGLLVSAGMRVRALWRRATPLTAEQLPAAVRTRLREAAGGREIAVCVSAEVDRPSVIGFFAPRILIPEWLLERLTPEELMHVLLHESGHLSRRDDWLNLLQKLALVVFPLNPALVWIERRLCYERELACDERVLAATGSARAYASCLTSLAEHRMTRRCVALVMGAVGRESELGRRVRRILAGVPSMRPAQARWIVSAAGVLLIAGAAALARCPQLVRFRDAQQPGSLVAGRNVRPLGPGTQRAGRFRAVSVMARTESSGARLADGARAYGLVSRTPVMSPVPDRSPAFHRTAVASAVRPVAAKELTGRGQQAQSSHAHAADGWVVMTSLTESSDGARIVMTSYTVAAPQRAWRVSGDALPSVAVAPVAQRDAAATQHNAAAAVQEFPSYAAVPVRGGWLVVQM